MKVVIIDDEPLARSIVKEYLQKHPEFELMQECNDGFEGIKAIQQHQPDLIFLDIQMPKINGFEMLELIDHPPAVIFTTAFDEYAIKAFEAHAIDYLLKPFEFERFLVAVNKVTIFQKEKATIVEVEEKKNYLFLNVQKKKVKILFSDIVYIESQKEYIKIVTTKKDFVSKMGTHEIEDLLPPHLFKRIHRSFIVSVSKIDSYTAEEVEVNGVSIPVGRAYRDSLENL